MELTEKNFLMFEPLQESLRTPDPALPMGCSKRPQLRSWRLDSETSGFGNAGDYIKPISLRQAVTSE